MSDDFRVSATLTDHPKIVKLNRRLGPAAVVSLLSTWGWTRMHRPEGVLSGMTREDVEIAAKWDGTPDAFAQTLIDLRLLDDDGDVLRVHNWAKHNPWAVGQPGRTANALKQNHLRHHVERGLSNPACVLCQQSSDGESDTESVTDKMESVTDPSTDAHVSVHDSSPPLPSPPLVSPPKEEVCVIPREGLRLVTGKDETKAKAAAAAIFEKCWALVPRKEGRKEALKHFDAEVRRVATGTNAAAALAQLGVELELAVTNYAESVQRDGIEARYIKHGSTLFNNFRDFITPPIHLVPPSRQARTTTPPPYTEARTAPRGVSGDDITGYRDRVRYHNPERDHWDWPESLADYVAYLDYIDGRSDEDLSGAMTLAEFIASTRPAARAAQ